MRLRKFAICCVLFIGACIQAHAQTNIRVNVPFDFTVGNQTLPAGEYHVSTVWNNNKGVWQITGERGKSAFVMTNPLESAGAEHNVSLVFRQFSGQYALVQFWPGGDEGRDVIRPKIPRTMIAQSQLVQIAAIR